MIWILLLLGLTGGIGLAVTIWVYKKMSTDQFVSPFQGGSFLKSFRDDVNLDKPEEPTYKD